MPGGLDVFNIGFPSNTIDFSCNIQCGSSLDGDVNADSVVDILDIILVINYILDLSYDPCSDINADGILNILDIIPIVNTIIER